MKTITCNFKLRGREKVKTIYQYGSYCNTKIRVSTGLMVAEDAWDEERMLVKKNDPKFKEKREFLMELQNYLEDPYDGLVQSFFEREGEYPSPQEVREELNVWLKRSEVKEVEPEEKKTFWDHFEQFIEERKNGTERKDDGSRYSSNTIKNYSLGIKHMMAFKKHTTFRGVTMEYHKSFQDYLFNQNMKVNSVARVIVTLKTFMAWAYVKKLHSNTDYQNFKVRNEEVDTVYCNEQKLSVLAGMNLSGSQELARDWFVIGCFTGLRVSDLTRLDENCLKDEQIHIETQKTRQKVIINLSEEVKAIIKKHNGFPEKIVEQHLNRTIKEVCKLAGFTEVVEVRNSAGGGKNTEKKEFWELVSSHTCRRSCATNMYLSGVPVLDIMKVTGHKTEKAFFRYIRVTLEETADRLKKHSFYQGKRKLRVA
jgi:integrase